MAQAQQVVASGISSVDAPLPLTPTTVPTQFYDDLKNVFLQLDAKYGRTKFHGMTMIKSLIGVMYMDDDNVRGMYIDKMDEISRSLVKEVLKFMASKDAEQRQKAAETRPIPVTTPRPPTPMEQIRSTVAANIASSSSSGVSIVDNGKEEAKYDDLKTFEIPLVRSKADEGLMCNVTDLKALDGKSSGLYGITTRSRDGGNACTLLPKELSTWAGKTRIVMDSIGTKSFFAKFYRLPDGTFHADTSFQVSST